MIAELTGVASIRHSLHSRLLDTRSLQRIVESENFEEIYKNASEDQRIIVKHLIQQGATGGVTQWLVIQQRNSKANIATLSVRELRQMASKLGIAAYNILPKASLLSAIRNKELTSDGGTGRNGNHEPH